MIVVIVAIVVVSRDRGRDHNRDRIRSREYAPLIQDGHSGAGASGGLPWCSR